jgi:hypothetical protein
MLLWGALLADKMAPCGLPGWPGSRHALVAFESKGDVSAWVAWGLVAGCPVRVVSLTDVGAASVDLLHPSPDALVSAQMVTASMVNVFEDGAIQSRSRDTLVAVWSGGLVWDEAVSARMPEGVDCSNPVVVAGLLCGVKGEPLARAGFAALVEELANTPVGGERHRVLLGAVERLGSVFGVEGKPSSSSKFMEVTDAPRNKLSALLNAGSWWSRSSVLRWEDILAEGGVVVVDISGGVGGGVLDEDTTGLLASMLMYRLWGVEKSLCRGWRAQGKVVSMFTDELALVTRSSPDLYPWVVDQGREYGLEWFAATQRPEQLDGKTGVAFMTVPNMVSFVQSSKAVAERVASQLGGGLVGEDVRVLPPWTVLCRLQCQGVAQPVFTVRVVDGDRDPGGVIAANGFRPVVAGVPLSEIKVPDAVEVEPVVVEPDRVSVGVPRMLGSVDD